MKKESLISAEKVEGTIHLVRGQRVILDMHLAKLYGVSVGRLMEQVKRNIERFPTDFMFQLEIKDLESLKSQFAASNGITSRKINDKLDFLEGVSRTGALKGRGGRRNPPYAFTEHGAVMAANVLRSKRAIEASIHVVRVFVRLRQLVASHKELADKLAELERQVGAHDQAIVSLFDAIRKLMTPPKTEKRKIGFIR